MLLTTTAFAALTKSISCVLYVYVSLVYVFRAYEMQTHLIQEILSLCLISLRRPMMLYRIPLFFKASELLLKITCQPRPKYQILF